MGNLISYSGISAKIKAMEKWSLREKDFAQLEAQPNVPAAVDYLKKFKPYAKLFRGMDAKEIHREDIEQKLGFSQFEEFDRIYQFANRKQKQFLDLYFMHYEIQIIKRCLRNVAGHSTNQVDLESLKPFFEKYARLDLIRLSEADSLETFISTVKGTPFYDSLDQLRREGKDTLVECESALDMVYFKTMWEAKDEELSKEDSKIITQCFGTHIDMLNIQWVWRALTFYSLPPEQVKDMLIPYGYHLGRKDLENLSKAENVAQLQDAINKTWYRKLSFSDESGELNFEEQVKTIEEKIYRKSKRDHPNSIAVLYTHFYLKEKEISRIITAVEKIRYRTVTAS